MEYIIIGICVVFVSAIFLMLHIKMKKTQKLKITTNAAEFSELRVATTNEVSSHEIVIKMDLIPVEAIVDESKLIEITDSKVLARVNNLVPGLAQAGNAANNAVQAFHGNSEVLYRIIIPSGAKLANSNAMEGAVRGIFHGVGGIKGHANLVAVEAQKGTAVIANTVAAAMGVASMVVGQYYMTQINEELDLISEGITKISSFQDNEYRSRVFSLVAHVKKIADFQVEILESNELRLSKIAQLDSLEEECTQLLGQANLTLAGYAKKKDLNYKMYEKELREAQNWYMYQKSMLDILYKISDLRYVLHVGAVSREQCVALLPIFTKQVVDTQSRLTSWHQDTAKRLNINTEETRRKRAGLDGAIHFFPGLLKDELNFKKIEMGIAEMIFEQTKGNADNCQQNHSEFYQEDVHLIAKDGKIYYLQEGE